MTLVEQKPTTIVLNVSSYPFTKLIDLITPLTEDQSVDRHVVFFGGSTAIAFYKFLVEHSVDKMINFSNLHFWFTDERMVEVDDPESNYGQFRTHFLKDHPAIPESNFHPIRGIASGSYEEMEKEIIRITKETQNCVPPSVEGGLPSFDLVVLGMGADGHTASLFPNQYSKDDPSLYVPASHPETLERRISLSLALINAAKAIALVATGAGKKEKIKEILPPLVKAVALRNALLASHQDGKITDEDLEQALAKLSDRFAEEHDSPLVQLHPPYYFCIFDHEAAAKEMTIDDYYALYASK